MLQKIKTFILSHKIVSVISLLIIIVGSYLILKNNTSSEASYITEIVKNGDITTYVTGTGQVEATNTLNLKPGTSGDVTYVGVRVGDVVNKGKLIASVDSRDAKMSLENAKISLAKLVDKPDSLTLLQRENSVTESYNSSWNTVSSFVTGANSIVEDLHDIYDSGFLSYKNSSRLSSFGRTKVGLSEDNYYEAEKNIKEVTKIYKTLSRSSSKEEIKNLLDKSYDSARILANTVKDTKATFDYMVNYLDYQNNSDALSSEANINSWLDSSNNYVTNLLTSINSINENTESLNNLLAGEDKLDIKSAELTVESKQDLYNDCFIYAPFDGVIATLTAKVGESSGSSIGTIITKQKVVTLALNEVDIASIKMDQKTKLTFDAIPNLSIEGVVSEIDSIGTVSSGVVTYNIKISFDSKDERIKPGMSVSAEIMTNEKHNILTIPSSAIKTKNNNKYVEVLDNNSFLVKKEIQTGIYDDALTEIISGLSEGDKVITKITTGTKTTTTKTSNNTRSVMGGGPMGGSAVGSMMR